MLSDFLDIEELFQKLEPILGKRVRALWLEYVLSPESEIEGLIRVLAAKYLNQNFERRRILLTPPDKQIAFGEYLLGKVCYGNNILCDFGLRENELIQHVAIFGRTGGGKTNVGFLIVKNLLEKKKHF